MIAGDDGDGGERDRLSLVFLTAREKRFALLLALVLLAGWGPGAAVANRPLLIGGVPMLWLWWVCWFAVWCIGMYCLMFRSGGKEFDD